MVLLFLWSCLPLSVAAQNNPYNISDELYPLFQRCNKYRSEKKGLYMADTLYAEATRLNDKKAQCLALSIPLYYYMRINGYKGLETSCDKLRECARKNNYLQYFYYAYTQQITYLLNRDHSFRALQKVEEMKNFAFADNHPYGIYSSFRIAGHIYMVRESFQQALEQYQQAFDYAKENLSPNQTLSPICLNLAAACVSLRRYQDAYDYVMQAYKYAKSDENRISATQYMCTVLFEMGRKEEFNKYYEQCLRDMEQYGIVKSSDMKLLGIKKAMMNQEYAVADSLLQDTSIATLNRLEFQRIVCEKCGDYKRALELYKQRRGLLDSVTNEVLSSDVSEMIVQIGNEQLKLKTQSLELDNTKLKLEQAMTQSMYEKAEADRKEAELRNKSLALANQSLELQKLRSETERKEQALEEVKINSRYKILLLTLAVALLTVIVGFMVFNWRRRRLILQHMARKNEELRIARDQAESADRMKTAFIQNMSHEIRTPLNSIVGFSQLLCTPDMELDDEQKQEFSRTIQHHSDLLTTLINDVLDLANLESGKYAMQIEPCSCNELCAISVSMVMHRKAEKVNLYFTSDVDDDYQIQTDGNRVKQVLINFLTNAEKFTEEGEIHLHCSLSENPGFITFSVTDTGPGIPPDKADLIFERFKKLDEFKQGSGLGLNICRIIAERLNGEVKVDKAYTDGARFLFILPLDKG